VKDASDQHLTKVQKQTNLYRNKHGVYFAIIKAGRKQIKRSLKTDDPTLAKRRLAEFRQKVGRLCGAEQTDMRFEELAGLWLESVKPDLKPSSYERRVSAIHRLIPFFRGAAVRTIRHEAVENWKIRRGASLAPRTYNIELETLKLVFQYAIEVKRLLLDNPAESLKRRKQPRSTAVIPNKEQFTALVRELRESPQAGEAANLVEFLGYSGCRLGEAIETRWRDVNFQLGTLLITGGELGTKNHEERTIPLYRPLQTFLERLSSDQFETGKRDHALLGKKLFTVKSSLDAIHAACERLGLPRFGHHHMRHFFCSNAIEAGVDFKTIAGWLGHKDGGALVAKTYGHLRAEHSMAMAKRITFSADTDQSGSVVILPSPSVE
jgi:integrase